MKWNAFVLFLAIALSSCGDTAQVGGQNENGVAQAEPVSNGHTTGELRWLTIEEALKANQKNPKMLLVDVYTDWCGWCKVMDQKTFTDPEVQAYINKHFYPVKFNAEQRSSITFNGKEYKFVQGGRRGYNELASHLLNGRLGYPSFAFLASNLTHLHVTAGFKRPDQFMAEMQNVVSVKG